MEATTVKRVAVLGVFAVLGSAIGLVTAPSLPSNLTPKTSDQEPPARIQEQAAITTSEVPDEQALFLKQFRDELLGGIERRRWPEVALLLSYLARIDPDFAIGVARSQAIPEHMRSRAKDAVCEAVGYYLQGGAYDWWHNDIVRMDRKVTLDINRVVAGWLLHGYDDVHEFIAQNWNSFLKHDLGPNTIAMLLQDFERRNGSEALSDWPSRWGVDGLRYTAIRLVADRLYDIDLPTAAAWFSQHAGRRYALDASTEFARRLSMDDPQFGLNWAQTLEAPPAREFMSSLIIREWARHEPAQVETWLTEQAPSPDLDKQIGHFAWGALERDPERALVWASEIKDGVYRDKLMVLLLQDLHKRRDSRYGLFVNSPLIPDSVKQLAEANP